MELVSDRQDDANWQSLLAALANLELRLGGKSRRGYGAFRVERISARSFNLGQTQDFEDYAAHPASLSQPAPALMSQAVPAAVASADSVTIILRLQPRGQGGGTCRPGSREPSLPIPPARPEG